jgi:hypothetical protein
MIPAIAFMLAAYMIPRILIATMAFYQQVPPTLNFSRAFAILLCVCSIGGVLLGLADVVFSGAKMPQ